MVRGEAEGGERRSAQDGPWERPNLDGNVRRAVVATTLALAMTALALSVVLVADSAIFLQGGGGGHDATPGDVGFVHVEGGLEESAAVESAAQRSPPNAGTRAGHLEMSGGRRLLMLQTSMLVAGLGEGLFALIVLYLLLLFTVIPSPAPPWKHPHFSAFPLQAHEGGRGIRCLRAGMQCR